MNTEKNLVAAKRWVLIAGFVNAIIALPFSLPFTYKWYTNGWAKLNSLLGGSEWIIPKDPSGIIFMVLAGLGLHLVGITLIYASRNLQERIGVPLLNGIIRIIFVFIASYHLVSLNGPYLMFAFIGIDIILGPVLVYYSIKVMKHK